uniref:Carboxylic ester hydrolase n=1 Tax=Plectus sambesii TaxID=2011161 RepID=A0A914V9A8_9BILA
TVKKSSADKNLGLLDIILGLQWTQNEIGAFGGDKNRVSIMGHSSGAQGVDQLAISPKTAGLFRQVIVMSGPVGMIELRRDANLNQSRTMAISAGCATEDLWNAGDSFEEILQCLRRKPVAELVNVQREIENTGQSFEGPMIDDADGVLPENSTALLRKRRPYQMLIGTTNREFRVAAMLVNSDGEISKPLLYIMCIFMAKTRGLKHPLAVGRACADDYSKRPSDIPDLVDDVLIYLPTYDSSEAMRAKKAVVYKYSFEYSKIGEAFLGKEASSVPGPFHAQDLVYVMGLHYNKFTPKDQQIRKVYSGVFADFVISGDPSPPTHREKWQPTDDRNNYFRIDFDDNM